jgi:AraC-like DNA-binding protein
MDLILDPTQIEPLTEVKVPIPFLKKYINPWADANYREYDFGYILTQVSINKKFSVFTWRVKIDKPTKLFMVSSKHSIYMVFMLRGQIHFQLHGFGERSWKALKAEILYIPASINEAIFEPGNYETLFIEMEPEELENAAPLHEGIPGLLEHLAASSGAGSSLKPVNMNYVIRTILKNILEFGIEKVQFNLEMQKRIPELLLEYIRESNFKEKWSAMKNIPHKMILMAIMDQIMQSPHIHNYPVEKMAKIYGISQTSLKLNFKKLFGEPLARFAHRHALMKARYLITTTNRSIDDIADEIGYPYRINFDLAFEKLFGEKPAIVRKFVKNLLPPDDDQNQ